MDYELISNIKDLFLLNTIVASNVGYSTYTQKQNNPQVDMEDMALNKIMPRKRPTHIILIEIWYLIIYCDNWCDS